MTGTGKEPLLVVSDLSVSFRTGENEVRAVEGVSFALDKGETLAIVGESGSGKSVTALSILQLLPYPMAHHPSGSIRFDGEELIGAPQERLTRIRGDAISIIFQEPMTSLNPLHTVERQIGETLLLHKSLSPAAARARILELLSLVQFDRAEERLGQFPHQLSGGQRQRVMIAMALANDPDLLIADEPTTALDVTIQAQILKLLKDLQQRLGMALLLITHDLRIVRKVANRVAVMTHGKIVEQGPVEPVFAAPQHAYTRRLIDAEPKGAPPPLDPAASALLEADRLKVWFPIKRGLLKRTVGHVKAVDGVSLTVHGGETLGVVGESGSGKTTLGLALLRLTQSDGPIVFLGRSLQGLSGRQLKPLRRQMQIVFQDPFGSLSPRMSLAEIVGEGLSVHGLERDPAERDRLIDAALVEVGLDTTTRDRYPHEFSGGQRQRIAIARAIVLKPSLVVLDEPTSALDRSVQTQIVELLRSLQERHGLAYLFISHDLKVVRAMSHRIMVMRNGEVVEDGIAAQVFDAPRHPYTKALLAAALDLETVEPGVVRS